MTPNTKTTKPKFSIIIATYNGEATLQRCLDSIRAQKNASWELIVMDGVSSDATPSILEQNESFISYWESKADKGIYHAFNKALQHASGEWVYFIGADDYLSSADVLAKVSLHLEDTNYNVVYGKVQVVNDQDNFLESLGQPWHIAKQSMSYDMPIPHQGTFHRGTLFSKHGLFNETFQIGGDYEFLLRELLANDALFLPNTTIASMQVGGVSTSLGGTVVMVKEALKAQQIHRLRTLPWWLSFRLFKAYTRLVVLTLFGEARALAFTNFYRRCVGRPRLER